MRVLLDDVRNNREKFEAIHRDPFYIGSNGVGSIAGVNPFCNPLQQWVYSRNIEPMPDISKLVKIRRGNYLEPLCAELAEERLGVKLVQFNKIAQHDVYDWAIATPDYITADGSALVECKAVSYRSKRYWEEGGAPDYYLTQVQWQMGITGVHMCYFSALVGEDDHYTPCFYFSQDIFDQLVEQVIKFKELVDKGIPPEAREGDSKTIVGIFEQSDSEADIFNQELVEKYFELKKQVEEAKAPLKELEAQLDAAKNNIMLAMNGCNRAKCGNYRFKVSCSKFTMPSRECERHTFKAWEVDNDNGVGG
jgi:putative phage-type endonuclease